MGTVRRCWPGGMCAARRRARLPAESHSGEWVMGKVRSLDVIAQGKCQVRGEQAPAGALLGWVLQKADSES